MSGKMTVDLASGAFYFAVFFEVFNVSVNYRGAICQE